MDSPTDVERPPTTRPHAVYARVVAALLALVAFAVPLFVGLDRWDMGNDEAIYSYGVERILERGEWMTPRSIPTDVPFLEKPPLKFWIVAGAMAAGLTPNDEFGMRVFDALFGAVIFGYVLLFAWRASGVVAGATALLVLFTFSPLLFEHGLRSNNMEGALVLSYCGGLYHFLRWTETDRRGPRLGHAFAVMLYTVLGFMTKFVAVAFLPIVAVAYIFLSPERTRRALARWIDWVWPALLSLVLVLPWFIYESREFPDEFWPIILGEHVVKRFTASLDPSHIQPWHYYFTAVWAEFARGGSAPFVVAGILVVLWQAVRGPGLATLLLLWWALPLALMSIGSSKVGHYAFPYLPPLALGAGWAVAEAFSRLAAPAERAVARVRGLAALAQRPMVAATLTGLALVLAGVATWTWLTGRPAALWLGSAQLLSNSSIVRPALLAAGILVVAGRSTLLVRLAIGAALLAVLPISTYAAHVRLTTTDRRPLHAASGCMRAEQAAGRAPAGGVYLTDRTLTSHPAYYYFRHVGPWEIGPEGWREETRRRALEAKTPVLLSSLQWRVLRADLQAAVPPETRRLSDLVRAVQVEPNLLLLLPGAFAACEAPTILTGATPIAVDSPLP